MNIEKLKNVQCKNEHQIYLYSIEIQKYTIDYMTEYMLILIKTNVRINLGVLKSWAGKRKRQVNPKKYFRQHFNACLQEAMPMCPCGILPMKPGLH